MNNNKKFKFGQLFTHNGHVYQVRKSPNGTLSCPLCETVNDHKGDFSFGCMVPDFNCAMLIPTRAYLKRIK